MPLFSSWCVKNGMSEAWGQAFSVNELVQAVLEPADMEELPLE